MEPSDLPSYSDLMPLVVRAVDSLGGSASRHEIINTVAELVDLPDEALAVAYPNRPDVKVFPNRVGWALSYLKAGGALESGGRSIWVLTTRGRELAALPEAELERAVATLDRRVRREKAARRRTQQAAEGTGADEQADDAGTSDDDPDGQEPEDTEPWREQLLSRLHRMTPQGFERFVVLVLRNLGLDLRRVGGAGDEGIDAIGTAPLGPVLSTRVAVQIKRYDPERAVSRDVVALLQRDAQARGAERAILVTLGRFTPSAREAAVSYLPTVELIDGERLGELAAEQRVGLSLQVDEHLISSLDGP